MPISNEAKAEYVKAIDAIWQKSMSDNNVGNINDEVVRLVDQVLAEIAKCSQKFVVAHAIFTLFYSNPRAWSELLINVAQSGTNVADWIAALRGSLQYRACVNVAALNYKSAVQLALQGI